MVRLYLPHGDNEYSASGLFHLSGIRALDYQTLKHTIEMQPVPEKHFMCDFAIAVAGNPNQRVSSGETLNHLDSVLMQLKWLLRKMKYH